MKNFKFMAALLGILLITASAFTNNKSTQKTKKFTHYVTFRFIGEDFSASSGDITNVSNWTASLDGYIAGTDHLYSITFDMDVSGYQLSNGKPNSTFLSLLSTYSSDFSSVTVGNSFGTYNDHGLVLDYVNCQ